MGKKTDRVIAMLNLVPRSPSKISAKRLRDYLIDSGFDVTERTVQRDLQELSLTHPIVLDDRNKPFGWSYMSENTNRNKVLHPFEALSLVIASQELRGRLPSAISNHLEAKEREVRSTLAIYNPSLVKLSDKVARIPRGFQLETAEIASEVLDVIYDGLIREKQVDIEYSKSKQATIHPLGIINRDQITYLLATFWNYSDIRQIALHRITQCKLTALPITKPSHFDIQSYAESGAFGFLKSEERINLVLHFKKGAARHLHETPISENQTITTLETGWVEITATTPNRQDLLWWILGFGDSVEVKEPIALREKVADISANLVKLYHTES